MTFTSLEFILFLLVTLALYFSIRRENLRQYLLLAASSAFYGFWDTRFLLLLWGAIVVAFAAGRAIEHKPRYDIEKRNTGLSRKLQRRSSERSLDLV